jgi:hypothetical protein
MENEREAALPLNPDFLPVFIADLLAGAHAVNTSAALLGICWLPDDFCENTLYVRKTLSHHIVI